MIMISKVLAFVTCFALAFGLSVGAYLGIVDVVELFFGG